MKMSLIPSDKILVCDKCFRACCFQGEFMCDDARLAGTVLMSVSELRAGNHGENEHYWKAIPESYYIPKTSVMEKICDGICKSLKFDTKNGSYQTPKT